MDTAAATVTLGNIQVGVNGLDETGQSLATPNNFAVGKIVATGAAAAKGASAINHSQDCDYPVVAGQAIVLNLVDQQLVGAGAGVYNLDVLVWVG